EHSNFVSRVSIRGDAVGTDDYAGDFSQGHERGSSAVGDAFERDSLLHQLPSGKAKSLLSRSRLARVDMYVFAFGVSGPNDSKRGAVASGGESSCVANRENSR